MKHDCSDVCWQTVLAILTSVGMASYEPRMHKRAFEASHTVVFLYDADTLVGFGRALSDGIYQAALYDCAVAEEYQGKGLGRIIMETIVTQLPGCNFILYASPGKEGFYEKQGFRKMKTGMALFKDSDSKRKRGFTE